MQSQQDRDSDVALIAQRVLDLADRVTEDRANNLRNRELDQTFNRENYVSKVEMKPMLALFWSIVGAIVIGVVGAGLTLLTHATK